MANSMTANAFNTASFNPSTSTRTSAQPYTQGLLGRVISTLVTYRQRQADREIARYIASTGGKFTDQTEREIVRRMV